MDPNLENSIAEISANNNANEPAPAAPIAPASKPKTNKALVWCLSILVIISLAAAGAFAYLYFSNANTQNQAQSGGTETGSDSIVDTSDEEVEITDVDIIQDLDEKIAILHDVSTTDKTIKIEAGPLGFAGYDFRPSLYSSGELAQFNDRLRFVIHSLQDQFRAINPEERASIENSATIDMVVDGSIVADKYRDVFGEELDISTYVPTHKVPSYMYNDVYDFYYLDPLYAGGGYSPLSEYYYKNKYTASDDYAYVYISTATLNTEDGVVYCDIVTYENLASVKTCDNIATDEEFTLDESNYEDYANYRFVFKKAEDGTYYFVKVEKV